MGTPYSMGRTRPFLFILGVLTHNQADVHGQSTHQINSFCYLSLERVIKDKLIVSKYGGKNLSKWGDEDSGVLDEDMWGFLAQLSLDSAEYSKKLKELLTSK